MRTIWKFPLEATDEQVVRMPAGAEVLTVQTQRVSVHEPGQGAAYEQACVWALVDPDRPREDRYFIICGTGNPIADDADDVRAECYVGTFQTFGGGLVWHVFVGAAS